MLSHLIRLANRTVDAWIIRFMPPSSDILVPATVGLELGLVPKSSSRQDTKSILEKIFDGFLNATPKRRTTLERRLKRKYGAENYINGSILLKPKRYIVVCGSCGSYHEANVICGKCYDNVRKETGPIIEAIRAAQGLEAVTSEVVVRYKGDKPIDESLAATKQIVETGRTRPLWFADNLVERKAIPGANVDSDPTSREDREIKIAGDK